MSLDASVWAWKVPGLSPAEKLVLLCLADFTNHDRECWPSQALISARCGVSRETVNRALSVLVKRGLVVSTKRVGPKGKQANIYEITMSAGCDEKSHPDVTKCHNNEGFGPNPDVTTDHIEPTILLKKDSLEPDGSKASGPETEGANDPPEKPSTAIDPAKLVFDTGRELLSGYGIAKKQQGTLIGRWRKAVRNDDPRLLQILAHAGSARRADIVAFVEGMIRHHGPPSRPKTPESGYASIL